MFGLFLMQRLGRHLILQFLPIARTGAPLLNRDSTLLTAGR
jgi:hypothetical protein